MGSCRSKDSKTVLKTKKILILIGSSSSASIHKALLGQLNSLSIFLKNQHQTIVPNLSQIPFFNEDLLKENTIPNSVRELLRLTSQAQAIIFITPEYNRAVSPLILNAYKWITQLCRAKGQKHTAMYRKPTAIMSCSYISHNQIQDIEIMTKTSNVKLFKQYFYVDLKSGQIDPDSKIISPKLKERLSGWIDKFFSFI